MPRKLKPFDMVYKNWDIRVTNIRQFTEKLFRLTRNLYKCKLILKRDGKRHEVKIQEVQADDKQDLEFQLRYILHLQNF